MENIAFSGMQYKPISNDMKFKNQQTKYQSLGYGNGAENSNSQNRRLVGANVVDAVTGLTSFGAFAFLRKMFSIKLTAAEFKNPSGDSLLFKIMIDTLKKNGKSTKTINPTFFALMGAATVGGILKSVFMSGNDLITGKYKEAKYKDMSFIKKNIHMQFDFIKNGISGALTGLMAPIVSALGVIGAPIYLALNSLNNYFIGTKGDSDNSKNFSSFVNNIKDSKISSAIAGASVLIPALIHGHGVKKFDKNLQKAFESLKNADLKVLSGAEKSTYTQIEDVIFDPNGKISKIIKNNTDVNKQIIELSKENIFALKFKQIQGNLDNLARTLKNSCPPSRTLDEAKVLINKEFSGEFNVEKLVGVGTVAETYLVKDKSGKEFCVKMLKNGIDAAKIQKDKDSIIRMIEQKYNANPDKAKFLKDNFEDIANGVMKEVDFNNEMKAAQELAKVTQKAKVVVPVKVSQNGQMYVMEKADGICLRELSAENIEKLKITKDEAKKMFYKYIDVIVEQFNKVDPKGKIIHGDIHPGNIFVDIDAMRKGEKNFLTLIDTGNTIKQTPEIAQRFLRLSKYIKNADVDNITKYVLEGAKLPKGMTNEDAYKKISEEIRKVFFDNSTHIGKMTNVDLLRITDNIMGKLNIIPNSVQGNLLKAEISADNSYKDFLKNAIIKAFEDIINKGQTSGVTNGLKNAGEFTVLFTDKFVKSKKQEAKNLLANPLTYFKFRKGKNMADKNSVEYLTYELKKLIALPEEQIPI